MPFKVKARDTEVLSCWVTVHSGPLCTLIPFLVGERGVELLGHEKEPSLVNIDHLLTSHGSTPGGGDDEGVRG